MTIETIVCRYLQLEVTRDEDFAYRAILWERNDQGCSHIEKIIECANPEHAIELCVEGYPLSTIQVKCSDGKLRLPDCLSLTEAAIATL